ncbi:MAG: glycosyltransferase family 4 protein [Bifidobacteriaceae bacterium]|jgi:glycosyltransferase involved in cell wall biosynthesis|nr:glycosyltransferase family 4 protein [Bifidobacteriaceae bacterium]
MPLLFVDLLSYTGTKGGMETYARELYRALGAALPDWDFLGMCSSEGYRLDDHAWFPGEVYDSGISGENRFAWARGELTQVARHAKARKADIVHCPATLGPRKTPMPTVMTMHDMLYWSHPQYMSTPLYTAPVKWMEKQAARNATEILTISDASKRAIIQYLGAGAEHVHVVPLGATPKASDEKPRPRRGDLVIAEGNRRPHKNFDSLIRALPLIPEAQRPHLVVTGSRGDDPLLPVVRELHLEDWVELKGWIPDEELDELHHTCTALAMPSFYDGFCLPALDAMLVGTPVLLSDIDVYREVGGDAALYFDPTDLASIAEAMRRVVAEKGLADSMRAAGLERVKHFTWRKVAEETADVFRLALERAGKRA